MTSQSTMAAIDVAPVSRHYRRIWRCCLLAGLVGAAAITPLIGALSVELEKAAGRPADAGIAEAVKLGMVPSTAVAFTIVAMALACLTRVGRYGPWLTAAGVAALALGAILQISDNWTMVKGVWKPSAWNIASLYSTFEAGVWMLCALEAVAVLPMLAVARAAPGRERFLTSLAAFTRLGRNRRRRHRTFRPSRLAWMLVGIVASFSLAALLQLINAVLFRNWILGFPTDHYRKPQEQIAFVMANPGLALLAAAADIVQVVLTVVAVTLILRFFWRLVVADAARLLEDPSYRPIVFLRSFADDAATVTSKRLFDRLVRRRRRLEEIAVAALSPLGTAIAIGQPGERLPKLGAVRAYYPDDQWQAAVLEWMRRAQLIALVGGSSRWTLWELRQALDHGYADRLVVLLPPDRDAPARQARWQALVDAAVGTAWEHALRAMPATGLVAVVLGREGDVLAIRGNDRQQADYEVAVKLAAVTLLGEIARPGSDGVALAA